MKGLAKRHPLIASISKKLIRIHKSNVSEIKSGIDNRKTIERVGKKLNEWVKDRKHLENYESTDEILNELGITGKELSFYCSSVLKKKFVTWRKELRINEAKELLLKHPDTPACHIGFASGFSDKSNFRQQFKAVVECTPNEWRARHIDEYAVQED